MTDVFGRLGPDFVFGVATASYQIEGSVDVDGRGESIWDRFSHTPGAIKDGATGDVACDHYRLWREDVALIHDLGMDAYRFSIAWPRVFPDGMGSVNAPGLDFYDRLVDELLAAGIAPYPTLYHWDLPQALEDKGGWTNRATAEAFAAYAGIVADRLGDRVRRWGTINEPWCVAELGYRHGVHAPGRREPQAALDASHHVLLAHGLGMQAVRAASGDALVGFACNVDVQQPRSTHPRDVAAARLEDAYRNRWWLDPVFLGAYPEDGVAARGWDQAVVLDGDLDVISAPMDYLGINYYSRSIVGADGLDDADRRDPVSATLPKTTMGWEIYPDGLRDLLIRFHHEYDLPDVFVTENGVALPDQLVDDSIHDPGRIEYLLTHFEATAEAVAAGVPVKGFFIWTLMDNFEWGEGLTQRFGVVWTNYDDQRRVVKDSGHWLASHLRAR